MRLPRNRTWFCLSSGESELMALVGGACEGYRNKRPMEQDVQLFSSGTIVLCTDSAAALGFVKRKGCKSTHSSRGHENLFHADLGNGTWTTHLESAW